MSTTDRLDAPLARTRIPEGRSVAGLTYGTHAKVRGALGYYVHVGDGPWVVALTTPAVDELPGDGSDEEIVEAVRKEAARIAAA